MKFIFIFLCFIVQITNAQNAYNFSMKSSDGDSVSLSHFSGVKILVAVSTQEYLQKRGIAFLDSLSREFPEIKVLIFPVSDIGGEQVDDSTLSRKLPNNRQLTMASSSSVRSKKIPKLPVIKFVTEVKENTHFNVDIISDFQLYVIDESGVLYAVLNNNFPLQVLDEALRLQHKGVANNQREPFN